MTSLTIADGERLQDRTRAIACAVFVFGALFVLQLSRLGWSVMSGSTDIWWPVGYDQGGGLAAFRYFVSESWGLNPLMVRSIGDGVAITLTDSNAALAVIAKLLRPIGVSPESWLGLWVAALPAANGTAGFLAVKAFSPRANFVAVGAGLMIGLTPFMLFRVFHPALAFHAPIILGIGAIGWLHRHTASNRQVFALTILPILAFLVHPYLGPMTALTVGAAITGGWQRSRITRRQFLSFVLGVIAGWVSVLLMSGVQNRETLRSQAGPIYTANPLNPIIPQQSDLWPGRQLFGPRTSWEGFSWVGAGILTIAAATIVIGLTSLRRMDRRKALLQTISRNKPSLLVAIVALFFATTSRIEIGAMSTIDLRDNPRLVWIFVCCISLFAVSTFGRGKGDITKRVRYLVVLIFFVGFAWNSGRQKLSQALDPLFDAFRSSGRFIWVPTYLGIVAIFVLLSRTKSSSQSDVHHQTSRRWMVLTPVIVSVGLVLQFADTQSLQKWGREKIVDDSVERVDYVQSLISVLKSKYVGTDQRLHITPALGCLTSASEVEAFRDALIAGSIVGIGITGDYSSRPIATDCSSPEPIRRNEQLIVIGGTGEVNYSGLSFTCVAYRLVGVCSEN